MLLRKTIITFIIGQFCINWYILFQNTIKKIKQYALISSKKNIGTKSDNAQKKIKNVGTNNLKQNEILL